MLADDWNRATNTSRQEYCRSVARRAAEGLRFEGIVPHALGTQARDVAHFSLGGDRFVLVPGGEVTLGFDASMWQPDEGELASFSETAEEYGIESSIQEHVASVTRRPRLVSVPSLIVERFPREIGWIAISEAEARRRMGNYFPSPLKNTTLHGREVTRVQVGPDGVANYAKASGDTHAKLRRSLGQFRLPTSDEWEHLCGGGARTLYRWGDHAPCDRYPTDVSIEEAEWRRQWVMSGGKLARPQNPFEWSFSLHRDSNAFGVVISGNPYKAEVVAEPDTRRGGDGGAIICGGAGFFMGWLTLATAFFDSVFVHVDPDQPIDGDYACARRVLTID